MKFGTSALVGLLMGLVGTTDAFSVNPHRALVQQKIAQVQDDVGWRAPMSMVAGGAERAYGEDYYDGTYVYKD